MWRIGKRKCAKYGIFLGINFPANAFSGSLSDNIYHWFFPLKREGDRAVFAHCWRFFAPAACRWGSRCGEGQVHGRGEKQATSSMGGECGTAGLKRPSRRTGEWCTPPRKLVAGLVAHAAGETGHPWPGMVKHGCGPVN